MARSGHSPSVGPDSDSPRILAVNSCFQWPCAHPFFRTGSARTGLLCPMRCRGSLISTKPSPLPKSATGGIAKTSKCIGQLSSIRSGPHT
eukprot:3491241-Pyramimonas_sp.AAC.1